MRAFIRLHKTVAAWTHCATALCAGSFLLSPALSAQVGDTVLARVEVVGAPAACPLPAHAWVRDAAGRDHLLVFTTPSALAKLSWPHLVLDAAAGTPEDYLLALPLRDGELARATAHGRFKVLHDDGRQLLLRADAKEAAALSAAGFALQRLAPDPLRWSAPTGPRVKDDEPWLPRFTSPPDGRVAALLPQVTSTNLHWLLRRLTGEEAVLADGGPYVISNRNTGGGRPLAKARQFARERFHALGLNPQFHAWTMNGYVNSNLVATQTGGALSNELVLVTAHLDNMPTGPRAPGADDNASGCVAVLTAAGLFQQLQFERSVRYLLFTGEEQGLLGSTRYAAQAAANHDHIVGVVNLDMVAWNTPGSAPGLNLYTRATTHPAYTNDLAIVALFTNCVTTYALNDALAPKVIANAMGYSDHAPFWNQGYPATLVIEEYGADFNPYYHTTNDTTARVDWDYFTAAVRGALVTAAHMARPAATRRFGLLEVADSDWHSDGVLGSGAFRALWTDDASAGLDALDVPWSNAPAPARAAWFQPASVSGDVPLQTDARPDTGDLRYQVQLTARATNETAFATVTNRLRFELLSGAEPDRLYTARVALDPAFAGDGGPFLCVTNLREALEPGGGLALPPLTGLTNGAVYGTCEIAIRALATNRADVPLRLASGETGLTLVTRAQIASHVADEVLAAEALDGPWVSAGSFTNRVAPDAASFESGWRELTYPLAAPVPPADAPRFFRLRRLWLPL